MSLFVSLTNACDILMMTRSNLQVKWFFCILPPECPGDMNMLMGWNGDGLVGKGTSLLGSRIRNTAVERGVRS